MFARSDAEVVHPILGTPRWRRFLRRKYITLAGEGCPYKEKRSTAFSDLGVDIGREGKKASYRTRDEG